MNRAAVAFRVAGSAAAAVALTIPPEPHAALAELVRGADSAACTYGSGSYLIVGNSLVTIDDVEITKERTRLRASQRIETDSNGTAVVCLSRQRWECSVRGNTEFRVRPRNRVVVEMVSERGRVDCYGANPDPWKLRKRGQELTSSGAIT